MANENKLQVEFMQKSIKQLDANRRTHKEQLVTVLLASLIQQSGSIEAISPSDIVLAQKLADQILALEGEVL